MYQKDYILRLIEEVARMLAAILRLIKNGKLEQASDHLSNLYYDILKQDAAFFRSIPEEELTHKLLEEHNYNNGHLEILAELFNAEAELRLARGHKPECLEYSGKSLILFEFVDREYKTYSEERIRKMEDIRKRMTGLL